MWYVTCRSKVNLDLLIIVVNFHVTSFNFLSPLIHTHTHTHTHTLFNLLIHWLSFFGSYMLLECQRNIPGKKIIRGMSIFKATLEVNGDGKCYFPCNNCRRLWTRRILRTSAKQHCKEKGNAEGGFEYRPLLRRSSLDNETSCNSTDHVFTKKIII